MDILQQLNWRYATKQFDPTKSLSQEQLDLLLKATNLTPSSYGLQPYSIIVIKDKALREKLQVAAYNQPQLTDASDIILFAASTNLSTDTVDDFTTRISKIRDIPKSALSEYEAMMKGTVASLSNEELINWASKQAYIALGQLIVTCATQHIDTCPMEGFDKDKFDNILGLHEKNLTSVAMLAIGYRSEEDAYQHMAKVRKPLDEMVIKY